MSYIHRSVTVPNLIKCPQYNRLAQFIWALLKQTCFQCRDYRESAMCPVTVKKKMLYYGCICMHAWVVLNLIKGSNMHLVDPAKRGHIHSLSPYCTSTADTGRVLTGATVDDGIHQHLQWVLASQQVDDLECVLNDAHCHQLLAIVTAMHHHGVGQTLHDGALCFTKAFSSIAPPRVWEVLGVLLLHGNIVLSSEGKKSSFMGKTVDYYIELHELP
uniref:Uncharacterized protein n=1 Tax=Electrophorus electricus TaxID=8005 RepID=A0AAY5EFM0_ELEEL